MGRLKERLVKLIEHIKGSKILLIATITLAAVGAVGAYKVYDYSMNNPKFCTNCHLMDTPYKKWSQSVHSEINCHECHPSSISDAKKVFEVAVVKPKTVPPHSKVKPERCLRCHETQQKNWPAIKNTIGHKIHFVENGLACTNCHALSVHEFVPPTDVCKRCHEEKVKISPMSQFHCLKCHKYTATDKKILRPGREDCLSCHAAVSNITTTRVTFPEIAHNNSLCFTCHRPHETKVLKECTDCHAGKPGGIHDVQNHQSLKCTNCHQQHNTDTRKTCLQCHEDRKEHNKAWGCNLCHNAEHAKP